MLDANLQPAPFVAVCGLDGEYVSLAQLVKKAGDDHDGLREVARKHQLTACPFREVTQVGAV